MTNTTKTNEIAYRNDARREQLLRELMSDLADAVERGDMTDIEANEHYTRVADRWAYEACLSG
jgi:hypothetical protein